jgi:ubiquinone/menaquinone biosynthesis C-methylase UbiE
MSKEFTSKVLDYFGREAMRWEQNYDKNGPMRYRIELFVNAISRRSSPGSRVLDLGCGTGDVSFAVMGTGMKVTGCDISVSMLEKAHKRFKGDNISFLCLDPDNIPNLPFEDNLFDAVVSSSVFEYLPEPMAQLSEIKRVLKPSGHIMFTVPDMRHPVRLREKRLISLFKIFPFGFLSRITPWESTFNYLSLSVNRFELEKWAEMLKSLDLKPEPVPPCAGTLTLLIAQKQGNSSPSPLPISSRGRNKNISPPLRGGD